MTTDTWLAVDSDGGLKYSTSVADLFAFLHTVHDAFWVHGRSLCGYGVSSSLPALLSVLSCTLQSYSLQILDSAGLGVMPLIFPTKEVKLKQAKAGPTDKDKAKAFVAGLFKKKDKDGDAAAVASSHIPPDLPQKGLVVQTVQSLCVRLCCIEGAIVSCHTMHTHDMHRRVLSRTQCCRALTFRCVLVLVLLLLLLSLRTQLLCLLMFRTSRVTCPTPFALRAKLSSPTSRWSHRNRRWGCHLHSHSHSHICAPTHIIHMHTHRTRFLARSLAHLHSHLLPRFSFSGLGCFACHSFCLMFSLSRSVVPVVVVLVRARNPSSWLVPPSAGRSGAGASRRLVAWPPRTTRTSSETPSKP